MNDLESMLKAFDGDLREGSIADHKCVMSEPTSCSILAPSYSRGRRLDFFTEFIDFPSLPASHWRDPKPATLVLDYSSSGNHATLHKARTVASVTCGPEQRATFAQQPKRVM
jgi:hypothetical protein